MELNELTEYEEMELSQMGSMTSYIKNRNIITCFVHCIIPLQGTVSTREKDIIKKCEV